MTPPARILLFGDARWATLSLQRLVEQGHELLGVVLRSNPSDPQLAEAAGHYGLSIFQPQHVNAPEFVRQVEEMAPDLNLSVSYDQILRRPILDTAPLGFLNYHAGMLPFYRGRNVINWALINGEEEIGLTAHFVNEGIDTGDIVEQRALPISWTDDYGVVLAAVEEAIPDLVVDTVRQVTLGVERRRPQPKYLGTYFSARREGDEWLDWNDTSRNLYNKIRAITRPGPGARTLLGQEPVVIWRASYDSSWPTYLATPGQVVGRCTDDSPGVGLFVKTGDSVLLLTEVQTEGAEASRPNWRLGTRLGVNLLDRLHEMEKRLRRLEQSGMARQTPADR